MSRPDRASGARRVGRAAAAGTGDGWGPALAAGDGLRLGSEWGRLIGGLHRR